VAFAAQLSIIIGSTISPDYIMSLKSSKGCKYWEGDIIVAYDISKSGRAEGAYGRER
jgi:hypothetical protein